MKAEQVDQALRQKFLGEGERLVFWSDSQGEFREYVAAGLPEGLEAVTVLDAAARGGLSSKLLLEREDTTGQYLIYRAGEPAAPEEDWLLDIRLYSAEFHADVASVWLEELGLHGLYLREHLKARAAFLANQERRKRLKRLIASDDDEAAIDLKMMAVVVGSEVANLFPILRALCQSHLQDERFDLSAEPLAIGRLEKMGLLDGFWDLVAREFGYALRQPSIAGLLRCLYVSEFLHKAAGPRIDAIAQFELPPRGRQNAVVCLTQWRDSSGNAASYDAAAETVAHELKLAEHLAGLSAEGWAEVFTFWEIELRIVGELKSRVQAESETLDPQAVRSLATERKAGHWLTGPGSESAARRAVADAYDAISAAAELFALRRKHQHNLAFDKPESLFSAYQRELYAFDQLYRRFCVKARSAEGQGWNLLKDLAAAVERVYDQGFLLPLGLEWGRILESQGFLESWRLRTMPAQQEFYATQIQPYVRQSERKRAFVIISDALRYEAAQELTEQLNGRYRMNAELSAMLGVLPSYTALGMASLLPHKRLEYSDKGEVLVDGKSAASTEARSKQLSRVEGMACQASDLRVMKRDDARAFVQAARVVYIYHNVIDARGDSRSTEDESFAAVDDCLAELGALVQICVNTLSADTVWVTADHGFLFQQQGPDATDRSDLSHKPAQAVKVKKRYVIGRDLGTSAEAHHGSTRITAGTADEMAFWVPRGANRFHFAGGARFVHGGAMPQEVLVPLITVKQLRGRRAEQTRVEKVSVQVLGHAHKITTPSYRFELIQTESISERRRPITLRAAIYDGTLAMSSVDTVTFDSSSESIDERKKSIRLELRSGEFDKSKPYRLVLHDAETDAEVQSIQVVIDRSFTDDF